MTPADSPPATEVRVDEPAAGDGQRGRVEVGSIVSSASTTGRVAAVVVVAALAAIPLLDIPIPGVFSGSLNSPGTLVVLATGLVYAGLAMSYDLLLGYTGLLSLGHALYFALGLYGTNLLLQAGWPLLAAGAGAVVVAAAVALVLGSVALRVDGVAFAMVTLAFAEAFWILVNSDPLGVTNGEEGLALSSDTIPDLFRGVVNTRFVFWLTLAFAVVAWAGISQVVASRAGHVYRGVRDNEQRIEMLGLRPHQFKLQSFVLGGAFAAMGGAVYLLVARGASPGSASSTFTLNLVIMVVLGGLGRLWGAALGGMVFAYLELRLPDLAGGDTFAALPDVVAGPLSEPLFILGVVFILLMMFVPGGLASVVDRFGSILRRRP